MITQVKFISIPVKDQQRALKFYTEKLGFRIATDQEMGPGGQRWIELRIGKAETRVVLFTMEGEEARVGTHMNTSLVCDDVDATYRQLSERGVEFEGPPKKEPWGSYVIMKDSEGNRFVVGSD
ncbi:MAG: VOC family protein [Alphaproteobacteria bacterium]|nr:VOC family protein [Alphaproteobacteria bacterium]MBL6939239.1 VOC family protein [Alphaproteobacteria bacterium]MBL7096755.1 VOC family protein [Alphaproteobacteria bacterium]